MPAYNEEAYIAEAVSSILNQSWKNLELIVVDDGSTDATAEVVRRFTDPRLRLLENKCNLGIAASAKAFPAVAELDEILWLILNH